MFGGDFHTSVGECSAHFAAPGFELGAVRIVADFADHEGEQVAEFVSEDIEKSLVVVDHFGGKLDGAMVPYLGRVYRRSG